MKRRVLIFISLLFSFMNFREKHNYKQSTSISDSISQINNYPLKAEDILNLFELIKNAYEENWGYNKSRLREILRDYEKEKREVILMNGNCTDASTVTEKVITTLQIINSTNSLDEILFFP